MLKPGDRVAVFTGRDYTTVADHGIVLVPQSGANRQSLVFLPQLNSYCLTDDESLLVVDQTDRENVPFAEIVFERIESDSCSGSYRRLEGLKNTFEFVRVDSQQFGYDIRAKLSENGNGISNSHIEIRIPVGVEIEPNGCLNVLRQILGLEYTKHINAQRDDAG